MKKCMITITEVLENETCQTVVLDISERSISVNCPKSTGIEVESINRDSHFELIFKLPHIDQQLHLRCKTRHRRDIPNEVECGATFGVSSEAYLGHNCQLAA